MTTTEVTKVFQPEQFISTDRVTAQEKADFANTLVTWVTNGFCLEGFTPFLYERLKVMFGHIAYYTRLDFYSAWFWGDIERLQWLNYIETGGANGKAVGDPRITWSDVEKALTAWVFDRGLVFYYQQRVLQGIEQEERALLIQLQQRFHELPPETRGEQSLRTPPVTQEKDLETLVEQLAVFYRNEAH